MMATADLQSIYNRLNSVNNYHPYTAETYADWSMEAGDIVTVSRNGTNYASPVHRSTIRWNGSQKVSIESRGEKTRGSITQMSVRSYNSGSGGGNGYRSSYSKSVSDKLKDTRIRSNEEAILLEAWNREQADNTFDANLTIQANRITAEVTNRQAGDTALSGRIDVQANKVALVVEETSGGYRVKAAQIVAAINDSGSSVVIDADHIRLNGTTTLSNVMTVSNNAVYINKTAYFDSGGSNLTIISGNGIFHGGHEMCVADITKSGNVLTVSFNDGRENLTFSKATTQSGAWSGGTYTVTARQDGVSVGTNVTQIKNLTKSGSVDTSISKYVGQMVSVYATENGTGNQSTYTGYQQLVYIDASDVWQEGYDAGAGSVSHSISIPSTQIYTTAGSPPSGSTNLSTMKSRVLSAIDDSETLVFRVDCGSASKYYHMSF